MEYYSAIKEWSPVNCGSMERMWRQKYTKWNQLFRENKDFTDVTHVASQDAVLDIESGYLRDRVDGKRQTEFIQCIPCYN